MSGEVQVSGSSAMSAAIGRLPSGELTREERLRRLCEVEPTDGDFLRELKQTLADGLGPLEPLAELLYLSSCEQETSMESLDVVLEGVDPSLQVGTTHRATWLHRGPVFSRPERADFLLDLVFRAHAATLSRLLSRVKRRAS